MTTAKTTAAINALNLKDAADIDRLHTPAVYCVVQKALSRGFKIEEVYRAVHRALSRGFSVEEIGAELERQAKCSRRAALIVAREAALAFRD